MNAAIFYATRRGSTAEYANWIGEATGLPVFNIEDKEADPTKYDLLILGSAILFYKPIMKKWIYANNALLKDHAKIFFTVSGAGASPKLERWLKNSLPASFLNEVEHFALRGRMRPSELNWVMRQVMKMGAFLNPDPEASKEERYGFDYMDKAAIAPIVKRIEANQVSEVAS